MTTPPTSAEADIVTIGDEILIGQVVDSNSALIARRLNAIGFKVSAKYSVGDDAEAIRNALDYAIGRVQALIFTGGLGPTSDDITKHTLAQYFGCDLVFNQDVYNGLERYFLSRGRTVNEANRSQAFVPACASVLHNPHGTAPGLRFEAGGTTVFAMPGVPYEMEAMLEKDVLPFLRNRYHLPPIEHFTFCTVGIPESELSLRLKSWEAELPEGIKLAYLPSPGAVRLRLSARPGLPDAHLLMERLAWRAAEILGPAVYAMADQSMEETLHRLLTEKNLTLSLAESCTGGFIAHGLTAHPGSSRYFLGSAVTYSNEAKMRLLGVPENLLKAHGAVSGPVAEAMAGGARKVFGSDWAVAATGVAGPDGGTPDKPVGTVYIAVAGPEAKCESRRLVLGTNRLRNIQMTRLYALDFLRRKILELP
ncbi:MAG: competence/damage-inducible protein A [Flavobacteriales bacterium]|nr:competence/damage-inducible protein A [Flavobacteriales bacterium]MDW8432142.1 competence/damage-inducible protein A [Flavobacteriales bacterium]